MSSPFFRYICLSAVLLAVLPFFAGAAEIAGPEVSVVENNIMVNTGLRLDERERASIANGVSKDMIFYVDLFRVWSFWPDEFVLGKTFRKTLRCDPVKKEFIATSLSGTTLTEKRFGDCERLIGWALGLGDIRLTNTAELDPDDYFVRVTVESRLRSLPPVISSIFFFVKETEFSIKKDSRIFVLRTDK